MAGIWKIASGKKNSVLYAREEQELKKKQKGSVFA